MLNMFYCLSEALPPRENPWWHLTKRGFLPFLTTLLLLLLPFPSTFWIYKLIRKSNNHCIGDITMTAITSQTLQHMRAMGQPTT